jgi:hypothetical protein
LIVIRLLCSTITPEPICIKHSTITLYKILSSFFIYSWFVKKCSNTPKKCFALFNSWLSASMLYLTGELHGSE